MISPRCLIPQPPGQFILARRPSHAKPGSQGVASWPINQGLTLNAHAFDHAEWGFRGYDAR